MASGGSDIDPRIDMNNIWEDGDVKFMESMLRATGKFHIIPIYEAEEENYEEVEEEEEEEHYDLHGPRGQIPATSTPIGTVPRSYSAQPPSYRPVRPPPQGLTHLGFMTKTFRPKIRTFRTKYMAICPSSPLKYPQLLMTIWDNILCQAL